MACKARDGAEHCGVGLTTVRFGGHVQEFALQGGAAPSDGIAARRRTAVGRTLLAP
jgi:hypothetical protein